MTQLLHVLWQCTDSRKELVKGLLTDEFHREIMLEVVSILHDILAATVILTYIRDDNIVNTCVEKSLRLGHAAHLVTMRIELEDSVLHTVFGKVGKRFGEQPAREDDEQGIDHVVEFRDLSVDKLPISLFVAVLMSEHSANLAISFQFERKLLFFLSILVSFSSWVALK